MTPAHAVAVKNIKSVADDKSPFSIMPNKFVVIIKRTSTFSLILFSSILLVLAFPKTDFWFLAWVAFIPLMIVLDKKSLGSSFLIGYTAGLLFFTGTLYWFIYVTILGTVVLMLYLAGYFGLFALLFTALSKRNTLSKIILLPSLWVVLEFIRDHLFTGFGWVSLGHSQYKNLFLIQISDITGMLGVSFVVMAVNVLLYEAIKKRFIEKAPHFKKELVLPVCIIMCVMLICYGYGLYRVQLNKNETKPSVNIAIVQGSIPQEMKWMESARPYIMSKYKALTKEAVAEKPDIIVWPETAFPSYVWEVPELFEQLKSFVSEIKTPLLLGLVTKPNDSYYNSALLIDKNGEVAEKHNKVHLVPFGEYIPLREVFPFLSGIVPIGDFTAGERYTVFPVQNRHGIFSVLICFEDTVAGLSRKFTKAGAKLLINITNDAWFQDTKAPFIHMAASVFRTVENRRPLVRATNTGISCFIDNRGRIIRFVEDASKKKTYVPGYAVETMTLGIHQTFYTKYGDIFTYFCFGSILLGMVKRKRNIRQHK